ncbi:unnamed protein product, partial [Prorocentrum cordatum]
LNILNEHLIIGGDWNSESEKVDEWFHAVRGVRVGADLPTRISSAPGTTLDFFYASKSLPALLGPMDAHIQLARLTSDARARLDASGKLSMSRGAVAGLHGGHFEVNLVAMPQQLPFLSDFSRKAPRTKRVLERVSSDARAFMTDVPSITIDANFDGAAQALIVCANAEIKDLSTEHSADWTARAERRGADSRGNWPPISASDVRSAAASFPSKTALGQLAFNPKSLCQVSDAGLDALETLAPLSMARERLHSRPLDRIQTRLVRLGKPTGGRRLVAQVNSLLRLWGRLRKPVSQSRE